MIHIEAKITDDELRNLPPGNYVQSQKYLLKSKGFLTYGGLFNMKLCGGLNWEHRHEERATYFIQVLNECPSEKDLEAADPKNWPSQCPTMKGNGSTEAGRALDRLRISLKCSPPFQMVLKCSSMLHRRLSRP